MRQRGVGEIFGQRQSGLACTGFGKVLTMTDLTTDEEILNLGRTVAADLVREYGFRGLPPPILAAASAYRMFSLLEVQMQDIDIHM